MSRILFDNVSVRYPLYAMRHTQIRHTLINFATGGRIFSDVHQVSYVEALKNVSFDLRDGDRLAIIGPNGAGKTTLLKTISGFLPAASGEMQVDGDITVLFSLSNGLDYDKTGYENIISMSLLLGMTAKQAQEMIPEIEEFCELGEFLQLPVRMYSEGMKLRLAFAVSTSIHPEILVLDEAIGAGDAHFLKKAAARAKALYDKARIMVMASHSSGIVRDLCNKALLLRKGEVQMMGSVDEALAVYEENL